MTDTQMWALIVGFFLPLVVAVVVQTSWPSWLKSVTLFVASTVVAFVTVYLTGDLDGRTWLSATLVILVTAIAVYNGIWKPTKVAPAIESATNISRSTDDVII